MNSEVDKILEHAKKDVKKDYLTYNYYSHKIVSLGLDYKEHTNAMMALAKILKV